MAIHMEEAYASTRVDLPHTEAAAADVVMLPLYAELPEEHQDYVLERLADHVIAQAA
jgi:dTDP-4-amino-4,6-dideoxygalactose transaminase